MAYLRPVPGTDGRRAFEVLAPADGAPLGRFDVANAEDVADCIARAREVQPAWEATPIKERVRLVRKALEVLVARRDEFVARLTAETARPALDTWMIEMFAAADCMNYYARQAPKVLGERRVGLHLLRMKKMRVVYRPMGVVAVISPWNGPFILSANPTIQAVLAGNAVVLKPSEVTPEAGRLVAEIFAEAGFPKDLVQVVLGDGETGAALIEGGVDKVTFTGSVKTGRKIGEICGRNLVPCTLELGGKDPMIVLEDADIHRASAGAVFGGVMNTGQFCSGIERIYVHESVAEDFVQRVVQRVEQLEEGRDYGPFIFEKQADIVERQVRAAVESGATVHCGGERRGTVFPPTVLTGVTQDMALMQEETFGPILPIITFSTEEEAIALANDCEYGLSASVWTRDKARADRIARQLQSGSATINETSMIYGALEVPFGGVKSSGLGQVNGANGLLNYARAFPILSDRFGSSEESVWFPYTEDKTDGLKKALKAIWGTPLRWLV